MKFLKALYKILPSILTILGAFAIGHNFFGATINESLWQELAGFALMAVGVFISVFIDHTAGIEQLQAMVRRAGEVLATLLAASGKQMSETIKAVLELILIALPVLYGYLSQRKTIKLARSELEIDELKGASKA